MSDKRRRLDESLSKGILKKNLTGKPSDGVQIDPSAINVTSTGNIVLNKKPSQQQNQDQPGPSQPNQNQSGSQQQPSSGD